MNKTAIKNRKGEKIVVVVDKTESPKGLAFVMHGLSGFKEQPHILTFAEAFKEKGFTVVRFDTTNTFGESEGNYENATTTNYYEDLEDVISWAKFQVWYQEHFYLIGHSLGGICILLYAEKNSDEVKGLVPISTVVSGALSIEAHGEEKINQWKKTGWREEVSSSIPDLVKKLKWNHMVDRMKYDVIPDVDKLTMPVLLIVGENDKSTPIKHQRILFEKLPEKKEIHVLENASHTFKEQKDLLEIKKIMQSWIEKVENNN